MRVLDIDLDFFVHGVEHWADSAGPRLDEEFAPAWSTQEAVEFLEKRCGLNGPLPGAVVEHHGEIFSRWHTAIGTGSLTPPFHVTHVDAHADLGLGDAGWVPLVTDLLHRDVGDRLRPDGRPEGLGDGNFLAFAIACRWITSLDYVHNDEGGDDLMTIHMRDNDVAADAIELKATSRKEVDRWLLDLATPPMPLAVEPPVPFRRLRWDTFSTEAPFDAVCLCRSPGFTPASCDQIFDLIRERFIDEDAWSR